MFLEISKYLRENYPEFTIVDTRIKGGSKQIEVDGSLTQDKYSYEVYLEYKGIIYSRTFIDHPEESIEKQFSELLRDLES